MNKLPVLKRAALVAVLTFSLLASALTYLVASQAAHDASAQTSSVACWKCGAFRP